MSNSFDPIKQSMESTDKVWLEKLIAFIDIDIAARKKDIEDIKAKKSITLLILSKSKETPKEAIEKNKKSLKYFEDWKTKVQTRISQLV